MLKVSVALVSQQPILLDGLLRILRAREGLDVVARSTATADIAKIYAQLRPSILVVDPGSSAEAFSTIAAMLRSGQSPRVVVYACDAGVDYAVRWLDAGVSAFLPTTSGPDELLQAIDAVIQGENFIASSMASKVITAFKIAALRKAASTASKLNVRETQIVSLLRAGKSNKEIAAELGLSEKTVKHYMTLLMQKVQARNRTEVAMRLHDGEGHAMRRRKTDSV